MERKMRAGVGEEWDVLTGRIVEAALSVHRALGPGLLESVYVKCLVYELRERGHMVGEQVRIPLSYRGVRLDSDLRIDVMVDDRVVVEVKAVEAMAPVHAAQLLTYLRLTGRRVGLLVNFNVPLLKDGIRRMIL